MRTLRSAVRIWVNRILVGVALPIALVHVAIAGRFGPRSARSVAIRWIRVIATVTGIRFEVTGLVAEPGPSGKILVANHSSPLDIAAMLVADPDCIFVAAADLFRIRILAAAMRSLGTVPVDRRSGNRSHLELPGGCWLQGMSLVVFPEGGIADPGTRRPFHRSAFALAIEHEVPIVPVAIHGSGRALPPRSRLGIHPATVRIELLEPLVTKGVPLAARQDLCGLAERRILAALAPSDGGSRGAVAAIEKDEV